MFETKAREVSLERKARQENRACCCDGCRQRFQVNGIRDLMRKFAAVSITLLLSACGYPQDKVTRWQEDVDYYANELIEGHIDPFHTLSESSFNEEILRIKSSIPHRTENELLVELMRLTRKISDGHTSFPLWGPKHDSFPFRLKMFGESLYVVRTTTLHKDILGAKLVSINSVPASEIFGKLSELSPFSENEFSTAVRAASYLSSSTVLNGLGIVDSGGEATFAFDLKGTVREIDLRASGTSKLDAQISHLKDPVFTAKERVNDDLWYGSSPDNKTVYLKFRRYTSISEMDKFARKLLEFINENQTENLIIDLRDNYGGDFFVGLKLAQLLVLADTIDWKSGVYTLIDNVTFSAAMSNAAQFSQILNSKLVGTPTGAKPSGYQDMGQFTLPHSGQEVTFSKRLYHFKEDQRDALYPDTHIEVSIEDCRNEYDRQLRWVLSDIDDNGGGDNRALERTKP